jgi:hypothetical protein
VRLLANSVPHAAALRLLRFADMRQARQVNPLQALDVEISYRKLEMPQRFAVIPLD